jgi:anti-anti-sigma regulatory factor
MTSGLVDHACCVYDGEAQLRSTASAFLAAGVAAGQRPIRIGPGPLDDLVAAVLGPAAPPDVDIRTVEEVYGSGPGIDPEPTLAAFRSELAAALADGYSGLRVVAVLGSTADGPQAAQSVARWEHVAGVWQSSQPVASICAYDRRLVDHDALAAIACLHPRLDTPPELAPFQLYARDGELVLTGEIDAECAPLLARVLALVEAPERRRLVIDASGLTFIDHRALLAIVEHLRDRRPAGMTLVGAPASAGRLRALLGVAGDELALEQAR